MKQERPPPLFTLILLQHFLNIKFLKYEPITIKILFLVVLDVIIENGKNKLNQSSKIN